MMLLVNSSFLLTQAGKRKCIGSLEVSRMRSESDWASFDSWCGMVQELPLCLIMSGALSCSIEILCFG
ncbi:hypothetical protein MANES_16G099550v8 [Manihot esculenta]|uniref:Uncharacterized protein n=2 Tax=Manihot esculenta TaxID=3983 RepID=A0ACB7G738_MANES|nr:hypothetical protein MANES_16G099550v8 [Manihot esculenta]KAG8636104.1 hypothetical protein MANES_16G099550v8 [Manihot esculenta]